MVYSVLYYILVTYRFPINPLYKTWILEYMNPIFGLVIVCFSCIMVIIYILFLNVEILILLKYVFMTSFYKMLPIYYLRKYPCCIIKSIIAFIVFFAMYLLYIRLQGENVFSIYSRTLTAFENKNNNISYPFIIACIGYSILFTYYCVFIPLNNIRYYR
jgi:hypothetical protein